MITIALLLVACDSPTTEARDTASRAEDVNTSARVSADAAATSSAETDAAERSLDALAAIADVLSRDDARAFQRDGILIRGEAEACVDASLDSGELVLDFAACANAEGVVTVSGGGGDGTSVDFDAFSNGSVSLDGTVTLDGSLGDGGALWGELVVNDARVWFDAGMAIDDGGVTIWGEAVVSGASEVSVALGTADDPLTWEGGCVCPSSGAIAGAVALSVDSVTIDLDSLVEPDDGSDDFEPIEVALVDESISVEAEVAFSGTCGEQAVSVVADDFTVSAATADIEAAVDVLCEDGDLSEAQCSSLAVAFRFMGDTIEIDVSASVYAEGAEAAVQAGFDAVCAR